MVAAGETSTDSMMEVHHAGHTVESEAIELVRLHVEAEVTEEEAQDLVVSIVEQSAIPELVTALATFVEVEVVCTVKIIDTIEDVLACMRMDHVQEDCDAHAVCGVNQLLQLFGRSIARARGEEASYLVSESWKAGS